MTNPTIPIEAIIKTLSTAMEQAVKNGANSVSMPDEYVAVAAWIATLPPPACNAEVVLPEPYAHHCMWGDDWEQFHSAGDPMPQHWDDEPTNITPLYTADQLRAVLADRERALLAASSPPGVPGTPTTEQKGGA